MADWCFTKAWCNYPKGTFTIFESFFFNECQDYPIKVGGTKSQSYSHEIVPIEIPSVISIRPNPANDWVMIELLDGFELDQGFEILISDISGKTIKQTLMTRNSYLWETGALDNGVYIVKVQSQGDLITLEKVVIQH
jgi:hypothetical protein